MNPEHCLANLPEEKSFNSQENDFNLFDFQLIFQQTFSGI